MIEIRAEERGDHAVIRRLNVEAFEDTAEAKIVDALRDTCDEFLSFVAVEDGEIVGHILFTPVTREDGGRTGMGLAPMAVQPSHQCKGIGSALVHYGLEHLRRLGCAFVIVLGHPEYYPRFGFKPASGWNFRSQWEGVPDEAFLIIVFDENAVRGDGGVVRYRSEFDQAM